MPEEEADPVLEAGILVGQEDLAVGTLQLLELSVPVQHWELQLDTLGHLHAEPLDLGLPVFRLDDDKDPVWARVHAQRTVERVDDHVLVDGVEVDLVALAPVRAGGGRGPVARVQGAARGTITPPLRTKTKNYSNSLFFRYVSEKNKNFFITA